MIFDDNYGIILLISSCNNFAYFFIETYVVGAHQNGLCEAMLMSPH